VLSGESQHVLHRPAPLFIPQAGRLGLNEGFQRTGNDLFGRMVPAGAELPGDQVLAPGIEISN